MASISTSPPVARVGRFAHAGSVSQIRRQVLQVGGGGRLGQGLVVLEQRQVSGVLLEMRLQAL